MHLKAECITTTVAPPDAIMVATGIMHSHGANFFRHSISLKSCLRITASIALANTVFLEWRARYAFTAALVAASLPIA